MMDLRPENFHSMNYKKMQASMKQWICFASARCGYGVACLLLNPKTFYDVFTREEFIVFAKYPFPLDRLESY